MLAIRNPQLDELTNLTCWMTTRKGVLATQNMKPRTLGFVTLQMMKDEIIKTVVMIKAVWKDTTVLDGKRAG